MDLMLKDKVAIVTGSRGICKETALTLAREGADLAITYRTGKEEAKDSIEKIKGIGGKAMAVHMDVLDLEDIGRMVDDVLKEYGKIDALINCAGVCTSVLAENVTEDQWNRDIGSDLKGLFFCCKEVFNKAMKKQKSGRIIMIASLGGQIGGLKVTPGYVASKAGVIGLTKSYARNGAKYGITANAVAPGPTETKMGQGLYSPEMTLLGRLAQPEDIAKAVLFLSSSLADYLTGTTIDVNGGALLR